MGLHPLALVDLDYRDIDTVLAFVEEREQARQDAEAEAERQAAAEQQRQQAREMALARNRR